MEAKPENRPEATTQQAPPTTQPSQQPQMTEEQREFLDKMNKLITSAQELSYALALLPTNLVEENQELKELVDSARNVVRATWEFHKYIKSRARARAQR